MRRFALSLLLAGAFAVPALAGSEALQWFRRNNDFIQQGRMQNIQWVNAAATDSANIAAGLMLDSVAVTTTTFNDSVNTNLGSFSSKFGWARSVDVTIASRTGVANDVKGATLTITGTNILGDAITEAYTITNNTENTVAGVKAFKTLVSFTVGAMDDDSVAVSFGRGAKMGLWNTLPTDTMILAWNGSSADASAAFTIDDDEIEKNVVDYSTDPSGTSDCGVVYWIPPFASVTTSWTEVNGKY